MSQGLMPPGFEEAMIAPHALNFAAVLQLPGKLYSFRWDEALRNSPANALAMRRDAFYRALLQERIAPTVNREFEVVADDEEDPVAQLHAAQMARVWRRTPDRRGMIRWLLECIWYGRSASQLVWGRLPDGIIGVTYHEPVNGDSIQFDWSGTPVVLVSHQTAQRYQQIDPDAVVPATDRGAFGIRLYRPEYRHRFVIAKFTREASDYFEGEMSGGIHGVGLRSWVYWSGWMRTEVLGWMLSFMQTTGMMDLLVLNYPDGNAAAKAAATENAKKISGKLALVVPRDPNERFPAVEQVSMNTAGVEVLRKLIEGWCERHIERLFVGQSMSAGGGGPGGLEGDGRAEFARDTKLSLLESDAWAIAETLTNDWLRPCYAYNFPGCDTKELRIQPVVEKRDVDKRVQAIFTAIDRGVDVEVSDLRRLLGLREPRPGRQVLTRGGGTPHDRHYEPVARPVLYDTQGHVWETRQGWKARAGPGAPALGPFPSRAQAWAALSGKNGGTGGDYKRMVEMDDQKRHEAVIKLLPPGFADIGASASYKNGVAGPGLGLANNRMAEHLEKLKTDELMLIVHHYAQSAPASIRPWATKANEVLVLRLVGGKLLPGQAVGIDLVTELPTTTVDVNAKLVTGSTRDNFKPTRDIPRVAASRVARGVGRQPFARIALFLSPKHPDRAGLYLTPGYAVGSFTAPHSQSILLIDLPSLHARLASGKLKSLIRKRMSRINWKKVKRDMVRTELQIAVESAQGQGAMVANVKRYAGQKKAAEVAKAGLKSLMADKEVAKTALQAMGLSDEQIEAILKQASSRD